MTQPVNAPGSYPRHFYSLDALRGFAALVIVFFHWSHFLEYGENHPPFQVDRQPFYSICQPFYVDGWMAVDLFFCLSGFIFFWLYSRRIAERKIAAREFIALRFSRLYPLHFVTLIFMAAGQAILFRNFGAYMHYFVNDPYDFVVQLFYPTGYGIFQSGAAFNGPTWSIGVEVLLYAVFFLLCFCGGGRIWFMIPMMCLSIPVAMTGTLGISRGLFSFFLGGLVYYLFIAIWSRGLTRLHAIGFAISAVLLWIFLTINLRHYSLYGAYHASGWQDRLLIGHKDIIGVVILRLTAVSCELILFPFTILTLAICETFCGTLGKSLAFLGQCSYGIYLLHIPLQLVVLLGALELSLPTTVFYSPWVMMAFFALLILVSLASFHFFELPMQKFLRGKLLPRRIEKKVAA